MSILSCAAATQANGLLQFWLLVRASPSDVQLRSLNQAPDYDWQGAPNYQWDGPYWNGAPHNLRKITASALADGSLALWAIDEGGALWATFQQGPNGAWGAWASGWNGVPVALTDISSCLLPTGLAAFFAVGTNTVLYQINQMEAQPWSEWVPLSTGVVTKIAACSSGGTFLFGLGNEQLYRFQSVSNPWLGPNWGAAPRKFHELAACSMPDGGSQLFAIDEQHSLWTVAVDDNGNPGQWEGPDWNGQLDGCLTIGCAGNRAGTWLWAGTADLGLSSTAISAGSGVWTTWDGPNWKLFMPPTPMPRWWSNSMRFFGGYVNGGGSTRLTVASQFTIEAWVLFDSLQGTQCIVSRGYDSPSAGFNFCVADGQLAFNSASSPLYKSAGAQLVTGAWQHVAVAWNPAVSPNPVFYLNAMALTTSSQASPSANPGAETWIGALHSPAGPIQTLQGLIGRLRLWNTAHDAFGILQDSLLWDVSPAQQPSLNAYYDFTLLPPAEISGGDLPITLSPGGVSSCLLAPAVAFQGNAYVDVGDNPDLSMGLTGSYTIDGWFRSGDASAPGTLIGKYQSPTEAEYWVHQRDQMLWAYINESDVSSTPYPVRSGTWQHFALTRDSSARAVTLYLDGNLVAARPAGIAGTLPQTHTLIGACPGLAGGAIGDFFNGAIQSVRIWNDCLSSAEVREWMYWDPDSENGLVADFDLSTQPPVDATAVHPVTLCNGANSVIFRQDVETGWSSVAAAVTAPPPSRSQTPELTFLPSPPPTAPAATAGPVPVDLASPEFRKRSLDEFAAMVPAHTPGRDRIIEDYAVQFDEAMARFTSEPRPRTLTEKLDGADRVLIHHTAQGDIEVMRVPAALSSDCAWWWATFIYSVTIGFLAALGLPVTVTALAPRLYNLLMTNPRTAPALQNLVAQIPALSTPQIAASGIGMIGIIWQAGLLWTLIKFAFGFRWTVVLWVFQQVVMMLNPEMQIAVTVSRLTFWALELAADVLKYPAACGTPPQIGEDLVA